MLSLHTIHPVTGSKKKRKTIGRGGKRGAYAGRGIKGQKSRSGVSGLKRLGMKPLIEATPKLRGFKSKKAKPEILNLDSLNKYYKDGEKVTPQSLRKKGLIDKIENGVKILGKGEINVKISIEGCKVSRSAKEKVEKAGGKVEEIKGLFLVRPRDIKGNKKSRQNELRGSIDIFTRPSICDVFFLFHQEYNLHTLN